MITRRGIYAGWWQWWFPWNVTDWLVPRVFTGADEWCNLSCAFVLPPFGCFVLFAPDCRRVVPCPDCWADMDDGQRADYAPCGRYYRGRVSGRAHDHWDGPCGEAAAWLEAACRS